MEPKDNTNQATDVFVESTNVEELRAQRVWQFAIVLWLTWAFNTFFLWYRDYGMAAVICTVESIFIALTLLVLRRSTNYIGIMNLTLGASAFGLLGVSLSNEAMSSVMLFYPVSILVASQLAGVRSAFSWFLINLLAFTAFFVCGYGLHELFSTRLIDELVLVLGVAACIYFCCRQGEAYYRQRTKNLIQLSQDLKVKSDTLQELATTDSLTGLMNRFQFQESLREAVVDSLANSEPLALFLIDMDGFKEINDTLGHPVGDDALVEIANRLSEEFAETAEISRLGGDEFCIIDRNVTSAQAADEMAERIRDLLTHRYQTADAEFPLGASVGYALCPEHTNSDKELLAFADTAMFHAKENRLGYSRYESQMTEKLIEYRTVQEKLALALEREEFFLVYQPQVDIASDKVIGVEALLRWRHDGEVIPPFRFIHLLERSREILPVSNWIVRKAIEQVALWNEQGHHVEVSVNVSALQFNDPDFYRSIVDPLKEFNVPANQLDLEITEGLLIDDVQEAVDKLNQIKALGVSISIDDFGTGYSSLSYLRQFPLDRLKIDRAFIKDIPDYDDGVIASSIIVLGKALGLKVLAEGVETPEHLDFLKYHDCEQYQGYLLSPPVSPEEVAAYFPRAAVPASR